MTRSLASLLARIRGDHSGVTAVEFGLLILPFSVMLFGGLDLAHNVYVRGVAQGALDDVSRRASVQSPQFASQGDDLQEQIEAELKDSIDIVAPDAEYTVTLRNFQDFNGIGRPEPITWDKKSNGTYDAGDNDCFEDQNRNGHYDLDPSRDGTGGANDIAFYSVRIVMPRLFPIAAFIGLSPDLDFTISTAVRNQPYAVQATPPVLCGV